MIGPKIRMTVPWLFFHEDLHKSNAAFDQSPCQQAPATERIGKRPSDAIEFVGACRFFGKVKSRRRRKLHAGGQPVGLNTCVKLGITASLIAMTLIQSVEHLLRGLSDCVRLFKLTSQIQHRRSCRAKRSSLMDWRQKPGRPVASSIFRRAQRISKDDIRWQILIFCPQPVDRPCPQSGIAHEQSTAVNLVESIVVIRMVSPHRIDQTNIIRHLCGMRQNVCHPHA